MAKLPYLRMYVGDALSDEKLVGLGLASWGAWMKVLFVMWKAQATPITKTRRAWCFTLSCTPDELDAVLTELQDNQVGAIEVQGDFVSFHSKRLSEEIQKITTDRERKRQERAVTSEPEVVTRVTKPKPKKDTIPTLTECVEHFQEKGSTDKEAQNFFNYYETVGWVVGRSGKQMKKWKSAAARWMNNVSTFDSSVRSKQQGMTFNEMTMHAKQNRRTIVADYVQRDGQWFTQ